MALAPAGTVDLPPHAGAGGFDHAAVDSAGRVYVAHTANDAIDVIDGATRRYVRSIPGLRAVAGALVSDDDLLFTSNRGENTVGIVPAADGTVITKVKVGVRPNGLAYDPGRRRLLAANVGDAAVRDSFTLSIVDVDRETRIAEIPVAGRTRWAVFDPGADVFHVNVADPPQIVTLSAGDPMVVQRIVPVPSPGPHGLDLDAAGRRLFCACDGRALIEIDADSGDIGRTAALSGAPDVIFFNAALGCLYVAVGEPGVIEVFDVRAMRRRESLATEPGAHTLAFDAASQTVYVFLPVTHRAAVYVERP